MNVIDASSIKSDGKMRLPFEIAAYEPTVSLAAFFAGKMDIAGMVRMREQFLELYYKQKHHVEYPNVLFDYQKKVRDAGHLTAYNYWILSYGDREGFRAWSDKNPEAWKSFMKWFQDNRLTLNKGRHFLRN
jgi:hypothetical protein